MLQKSYKNFPFHPAYCYFSFCSEAVIILFSPINILCEACCVVGLCGVAWFLVAKIILCQEKAFQEWYGFTRPRNSFFLDKLLFETAGCK